jgi:hypothetical protein
MFDPITLVIGSGCSGVEGGGDCGGIKDIRLLFGYPKETD